MKTLSKISKIIFLLTFLVMVNGCKKEDMGSSGPISSSNSTSSAGSMQVAMTDSPGNYSKVNVEITGVSAHYANEMIGAGGWVDLATQKGVYNLLQLQNNITVILAKGTQLPLGKITQLRLMLGSNNSVVLSNDASYSLIVPSGDETGIKINVDAAIVSHNGLKILLDFNASSSIVVAGKDGTTFILKPVIEVKSITYDFPTPTATKIPAPVTM